MQAYEALKWLPFPFKVSYSYLGVAYLLREWALNIFTVTVRPVIRKKKDFQSSFLLIFFFLYLFISFVFLTLVINSVNEFTFLIDFFHML